MPTRRSTRLATKQPAPPVDIDDDDDVVMEEGSEYENDHDPTAASGSAVVRYTSRREARSQRGTPQNLFNQKRPTIDDDSDFDGLLSELPGPWQQSDEDALDWNQRPEKVSFSRVGPNHKALKGLWKVCLRVMHCTPFELLSPRHGLSYLDAPDNGRVASSENPGLWGQKFCQLLSRLIVQTTFRGSRNMLRMFLQWAVICRTDDRRNWQSPVEPLSNTPFAELRSVIDAGGELPSLGQRLLELMPSDSPDRGEVAPCCFSEYMAAVFEVVDRKNRSHLSAEEDSGFAVRAVTTLDLENLLDALKALHWLGAPSVFDPDQAQNLSKAARSGRTGPHGDPQLSDWLTKGWLHERRLQIIALRRQDNAPQREPREQGSEETSTPHRESEGFSSPHQESEEILSPSRGSEEFSSPHREREEVLSSRGSEEILPHPEGSAVFDRAADSPQPLHSQRGSSDARNEGLGHAHFDIGNDDYRELDPDDDLYNDDAGELNLGALDNSGHSDEDGGHAEGASPWTEIPDSQPPSQPQPQHQPQPQPEAQSPTLSTAAVQRRGSPEDVERYHNPTVLAKSRRPASQATGVHFPLLPAPLPAYAAP